MITPNYERRRTRELLLAYNSNILPMQPFQENSIITYPWEYTQLATIEKQLYQIAKNSGFNGTENDFLLNFGRYISNRSIIYDIYINFPEIGETDKLYFDLEEKILYYWDNGYYPVRATLITNTILEGGEA